MSPLPLVLTIEQAIALICTCDPDFAAKAKGDRPGRLSDRLAYRETFEGTAILHSQEEACSILRDAGASGRLRMTGRRDEGARQAIEPRVFVEHAIRAWPPNRFHGEEPHSGYALASNYREVWGSLQIDQTDAERLARENSPTAETERALAQWKSDRSREWLPLSSAVRVLVEADPEGGEGVAAAMCCKLGIDHAREVWERACSRLHVALERGDVPANGRHPERPAERVGIGPADWSMESVDWESSTLGKFSGIAVARPEVQKAVEGSAPVSGAPEPVLPPSGEAVETEAPPSPARTLTRAELEMIYKERAESGLAQSSGAEDWEFLRQYSPRISREKVRTIRKKLAPEQWRKSGRRPSR